MLPALRPLVPSLLAAAVLTASGCAGPILAEESAAPIGCPVDAIEISEVNTPLEGPQWWFATCTDREPPATYFCSRLKTDLICSDAPPGSRPEQFVGSRRGGNEKRPTR